jgi:hypothetical protein
MRLAEVGRVGYGFDLPKNLHRLLSRLSRKSGNKKQLK